MSAYLKALTPFAIGLVLTVLGVVLADETLRTLGYGALGSSLLVWGVPNTPTPTPTQPTQPK